MIQLIRLPIPWSSIATVRLYLPSEVIMLRIQDTYVKILWKFYYLSIYLMK
jgi:hypothetical protein